MKNIIFILIFILSSCKYDNKINQANETKHFEKVSVTDTVKHKNDGELKELSLPYCFKIDILAKGNYYQTNLDTFLIKHKFIKSNMLKINTRFHKGTEDFISDKQANFMHYPYEGKAFAISTLKINNKITSVIYAYLFDSEMIQPRIEIQTFDDKQNNIDNLIIASTFSSECSGYRDFCINENKIITINNNYYCNDIEYKNQYKYKINNIGRFVFSD